MSETRATYLTVAQHELLLDWGINLRSMFNGKMPYLVGSSVVHPRWRDVDVRIMLDEKPFVGLNNITRINRLNLAVSMWGSQVTGLPIDFQVQLATDANAEFGSHIRHPLFRVGAL